VLEGNTELWAGLGHAYAVSGKKDEAQKVLDQLKELSEQRVAVIYAGLECGTQSAHSVWSRSGFYRGSRGVLLMRESVTQKKSYPEHEVAFVEKSTGKSIKPHQETNRGGPN
jgi:hypothetical protein